MFELDKDANLKDDNWFPSSFDWADISEKRTQDKTTGTSDDSFGQGAKEDTAIPTVVNGSIPPNKSDLKFFGAYQEGNTNDGFLHLFLDPGAGPQRHHEHGLRVQPEEVSVHG